MPTKIGLSALIVLVAVALAVPVTAIMPTPFSAPVVPESNPDARKTEADRLLQQGIEQWRTFQFQAALESFQQALSIYR